MQYAIAIQEPWCSAILFGVTAGSHQTLFNCNAGGKRSYPEGNRIFKDWENRSWKLPERFENQPVLLLASKKFDHLGKAYIESMGLTSPNPDECIRGAIVGEIVFSSCQRKKPDSPWAIASSPYYWKIASARSIHPIPYKGKLGFFPVEL